MTYLGSRTRERAYWRSGGFNRLHAVGLRRAERPPGRPTTSEIQPPRLQALR